MGDKKKANVFQGGYFHGDIWFQQNVKQRTIRALEEKERLFMANHSGDTNAQLLAYLRSCAQEKKRTPHQCEVVGGDYISRRFHGWDSALQAAGLPPAGIPPKGIKQKLYREEYARQEKLFKTVGKEERARERREKNAAAEAEQKQLIARDERWGAAHGQDTDEQLLDYIRACAKELGRTPLAKEVLGGYYISGRFGGWAVALLCAELYVPRSVGKVSDHQIKTYKAWLRVHRPGTAPVIVPRPENEG